MRNICTAETTCQADGHVEGCPAGATVEARVEASSLGTPEAKALRATVSDEHAARIVARARELEDVEALAEREREALLRTVHMATCYSAMKHTWESDEYVICVRTARAIISTGQWGSAQRDAQHDAQVAAAAEAAAGERIAQAIEADRNRILYGERGDGWDRGIMHAAAIARAAVTTSTDEQGDK